MKIIICPDCGIETERKNYKKPCKECGSSFKIDQYFLFDILADNVGSTYIGFDFKNKRRVIIKELSLNKIDNWDTEKLFKREAKVLSRFNHPLIPKFIKTFSIGVGRKRRLYLVMQYIRGENLEKERRDKYYTTDEILDIIKDVAIVLEYLHTFTPPIIHRDLKPSNLMRKKNGRVALIDFGTVENANKSQKEINTVGTFGYMAPEQYNGKTTLKSDYYSLGVIAITLLSRKDPTLIYEEREFNWKKHVDVEIGLKSLLESLLKYSEEERINSAKEIIKMIDSIKSGNFTPKKSFDLDYYKKRYKKRRKKEPLRVYFEKRVAKDQNSLISLAQANQWEKVFEKIKSGKDINELGDFNENLLHYATDINDETIVKSLLNKGIDINNKNEHNQSVLLFALNEKRYNIAKILLKTPLIDVNIIDNNGKSALMIAAEVGDIELFASIFTKVDLDYVDKNNDGAIFYAYKNENYAIVEFLLDHGSDINQKDSIGETILIKCAREGKSKLLKRVVSLGADLEIKDHESETALFNAIKHSNHSIFKYLIEHGADVNTQDDTNSTPLMRVVERRNIELTKLLLEHGAEKLITNDYNDSAVKIAKYQENVSILNLLKNY